MDRHNKSTMQAGNEPMATYALGAYRRDAIPGQAPFHEWDGYLLSLPDHQGNLWYRPVLVHKTREWAPPMNQLLAAATNWEEDFREKVRSICENE
jgi:hypothetical protein